jgi:hypothetical protein
LSSVNKRVVPTRFELLSGRAWIATMLTGCAHSLALALAGAASASESSAVRTTARGIYPANFGETAAVEQRLKRRVSVFWAPLVNVTLAVSLWVPALTEVTVTLVAATRVLAAFTSAASCRRG